MFTHFCGVEHVPIHRKTDYSRCLLKSTSSCKHCICVDFSYFDSKIESSKIKGKFSSKKTKSGLTSYNIWYHSSLWKTNKQKTYKIFFTKHFSTFYHPIKNQTKIKCSIHKNVKEIANHILNLSVPFL